MARPLREEVHLVVQTPDANLAVGMQAFHGFYAQTYLALNPVEAGLAGNGRDPWRRFVEFVEDAAH